MEPRKFNSRVISILHIKSILIDHKLEALINVGIAEIIIYDTSITVVGIEIKIIIK